MIEFLDQYISSEASAEGKINRLREALQLVCLKALQDGGYFTRIAFVGGTALRILYDMKRFSEDLDFSVTEKNGYDFSKLIADTGRSLALSGLEAEPKTRVGKTVQVSMLRFPGLLNRLGLSALEGQKLSIKVEVYSDPPPGWQAEDTVVNKIFLINIRHFSIPSLFATKLHACFFRKYVKGRDYYDLLWYLGKNVRPNYGLLNSAIRQTQGIDMKLSESTIKDFLLEKLDKVDFGLVKSDVERFLEDKGEVRLLEKGVIAKSIERVFGNERR